MVTGVMFWGPSARAHNQSREYIGRHWGMRVRFGEATFCNRARELFRAKQAFRNGSREFIFQDATFAAAMCSRFETGFRAQSPE